MSFCQSIKNNKRIVFFALQWGISLAALVYAVWGLDFQSLYNAMAAYSPMLMVLPLVFVSVDYFFMALRIHGMLLAKCSVATALKAIIICIGYNNVLPAKAGDILKIVFLKKRCTCEYSEIVTLVFWERFFDVLALLTVALIVNFSSTPIFSYELVLSSTILVVGIIILLRLNSSLFHKLYSKIPFPLLSNSLHDLHKYGIDEVRLPWILRAAGITTCIWTIYAGTFIYCLLYIADFSLSLQQCLTVFVVSALGMALPSAPGGLGVFEAATVMALSWYGIAHEQALGIALFIHAIHFIPVTLVAFGFGNVFKNLLANGNHPPLDSVEK